MTNFILGVFEITIGMSLFIALLLLGLKLFGGKFTAKCRYIIWALVMLRLAIPFSFGLLPTLIEIPIETELIQTEDLSSTPSENTDPITPSQPSDPGNIAVNPTVPSTPVFPNVDPVNPDNTPILPGEQAEPVIPSEPIVEIPAEQPISLKQILDIAGIVYLIGAAGFLVWSLVSYFIYTGKILRSAKVADNRTQQIFSTICKKYGIKKQPTLLVASQIHSPAAFGIFRRRIVLPDIAFTENGLVGTLAHEVTHCKRGDLYVKLVELIARSLNWFNPLVHIAAFKCEMEMELSCDEKVLSGSSDAAREAYADVMLDIIRRCRRNRGALTTHFNPKKSAVTARFKNILYGSGKRRGWILIAVCLVLCVLAGTIVACTVGDDSADDHWYAEGTYLKCDNGSDVIVMDAEGANPASPCKMTAADDSVSFEGLTDGDRIKIEISMIMTTYPGQTEVYSIEKLSDGEMEDIDPVVLDSLRELGWIGIKDENTLPDNFTEFYHEAEAVYAMFTGYRSDIYSVGTFTDNGAQYQSVDINGYTTLAELRAYCERYFGSELTDELMSKTVSEQHPLYREHKGKLFRFGGYTAQIGYDVGQNYYMTLENVENGIYTVKVVATITEGNRTIPATAYCTYTITEDGEIRFTSFELMAEKFCEILIQIPVDPEPQEPFDPDRFAELIPNSSAERLFWHQIAGTDDYLYFCAIRKINSTMTSYTDDPPKDFAIYHVNSQAHDMIGYIEAVLPADLQYDTVCPVVAMTGFGPMSCKFILQMTDGDRVFYVAFDNFDNLQQHLSFTYRGILSDDEVNELKEKYPVSFEKASKYYMGIPKEQYCFEYGGVQYDLSKIYSEVNGVEEWGHIGKYVVAKGHINPNDSLYVLINTETQKIEHHFVAAVMTYHSEDINTIVYSRWNTVRSFDGTFFVDLVLGPGEYIRELKYSEDRTQIIVTIETKDSSMRTSTIELFPPNTNNQMTKYTETDEQTGYELSFEIPESWNHNTDGVLYDKNGNKRIDAFSFHTNYPFESFQEDLRKIANGKLHNLDYAITGGNKGNFSYIGYHVSVNPIGEEGPSNYYFCLTYNDEARIYINIYGENTDNYRTFYDEYVLPIIQSVTIEEKSTNAVFTSILENKRQFQMASTKESMLLSEYKAKTDYSVKKYTILDLNDDRDPEMVLWLGYYENDYAGFLVLHRDGDAVYAHDLPHRGFNGLNADGIYTSSSSAFNMSICKFSFDGDACTKTVLARREGDGTPESIKYYVADREVNKDEFESYYKRYDSRSIPDWYSYDIETITDIDDWHMLLWAEYPSEDDRKPSQNVYNFIYNLVSGESDISELNELGIKEYSIALLKDAAHDSLFRFTFTVTGNSLPETLPPGTYSWTILDGLDLSIYRDSGPDGTVSIGRAHGLNEFGEYSAVQAVDTYLCWMPYIYEVSPYGEWDPENYHLPYNYICAYYGDENTEISFTELKRLMSEKFGVEVERPEKSGLLSRCEYNKERDTVRYADTRGYEAVHRFLDVREEDGITYVSVLLFADKHYLIPSHTIQYKIGEGDIFLGCEIIREGNYAPRELS